MRLSKPSTIWHKQLVRFSLLLFYRSLPAIEKIASTCKVSVLNTERSSDSYMREDEGNPCNKSTVVASAGPASHASRFGFQNLRDHSPSSLPMRSDQRDTGLVGAASISLPLQPPRIPLSWRDGTGSKIC